MTALSDALTAAQRSALAALEKAYVAGALEAEAMSEAMESCGITDAVDRAFLIASLDILKEWGVSAPNLTERLARENGANEPASQKQLDYIARLCSDVARSAPSCPLTKAQASEVIDQLQAGTYDPARWGEVPF